jgi:hypothetical protein
METITTTGPWEIQHDPSHYDTASTVVGGKQKPFDKKKKYALRDEMIVQVGGFSDIKTQEANTRLIKSAPDMYVLLQDLLSGRADVDHDLTRDRIRYIINFVENRK